MRRVIVSSLSALLALASATACSSGDGSDFWGNPANEAAACAATGATPAPARTSDVADELKPDGWKNRPGDVAPGHSWILIGVNVRAIDPAVPGVGIDYCVLADVHIEVEAHEADTMLGNNPDGPRVYDFGEVTTPWINHFIPFDYDPTDPRFQGRPPRYHVRVDATYVPTLPAAATPRLMICELTIWGGSVASGTQVPADGPAECTLSTNTYDRYDQYAP